MYYPLVYITTFLLINLVSAMLIVSTSILSTQTSPDMFSSSPRMTITTKFDSRKKDSTHTFAANYVQKPTRRGRAAHVSFSCHPFNRDKALIQRNFSSRNGDSLLIPYGYKTSSHAGDDHRALEAVLKLYSAIKQRNLLEVSNVIGEECRCFCNFIPYFLPFYGKKQVMELFSYIMKYMGEHIEFVVQPTLHDGMTVSVKWKLEWAKTHMPLGKGFSFYVCHTYQGKVVIKHMEMFMEPIIHIEPLRMKMMRLLTPLLEKTEPPKGKLEKIMYLLFSLVFTVAVLLMYRFFLG